MNALHFQERQIRYKFIASNEKIYSVEKMCKCMKVSRNAYYNWRKNKDVNRSKKQTQHLKQRIKQLFTASKEIYGSYRIQKMLEREGLKYSRS